jgi:anti-anti-sigma factor
VKSEETGGFVVLHCAGRIVKGEETALLCPAVRLRGRNVILDLREVDAIDAAGVGALISLQATGIYLHLLDPNKAVREVLRVTGVDSIFEINNSLPSRSDEEGALLAMAALTPLPA